MIEHTLSKKLKVCVVGAGDMGVRHLNAWNNIPGCEVIGLVDGIPERLNQAGKEYRVSGLYSDYKLALQETRPDVVSVCLPTSLHAPVSLAALEQGAHVLCEKPIALTLEEACLIKEMAERKGLVLAIGFMLRYSQGFARLKEWVSHGRLGRPLLVTSENFMEIRPKIVMHAKEINGGPVMDYWCHHFDLWRWLFDSEVESVSGYGAVFAAGKAEVENLRELAIDTAGINIRYRSGDMASFTTSWGLPRAFVNRRLNNDRLVGPEGYITGDIRGLLKLETAAGESEEFNNAGVDWWQLEINALAKVLREGGGYIGVDEGIRALEVSLAALEAIKTGQTVRL
jgi:predicted dehydrogenase